MLSKIFSTNRKPPKRKFVEELFTEDSVSKIVPPMETYIPAPDFIKRPIHAYGKFKPAPKEKK